MRKARPFFFTFTLPIEKIQSFFIFYYHHFGQVRCFEHDYFFKKNKKMIENFHFSLFFKEESNFFPKAKDSKSVFFFLVCFCPVLNSSFSSFLCPLGSTQNALASLIRTPDSRTSRRHFLSHAHFTHTPHISEESEKCVFLFFQRALV